MAENKQKLRQYQWIQKQTQLTLKGDAKPPTENSCLYGPDGQVQKTPIGPPPEQPSGGSMKQKIIAKKTGEMKDYMQDVKTRLNSCTFLPDPQKNAGSLPSRQALLESCTRRDELGLH